MAFYFKIIRESSSYFEPLKICKGKQCMLKPEIPVHEEDRLAALDRYHILDTLQEHEFDDLTQLAANICNTPIALISLIDRDRQWFKSRVGLDTIETPRDVSFCGHIVATNEILIVPDTTEDLRFADNPLVVDDPNIRFYAGVPLKTPDNFTLGTLCVIDRQPRVLTSLQMQQLESLSRLVISQFESRLNNLSSRLLASVVETSNDAIITQTLNGTITSWNPAAEKIFGYKQKEIVGQSIYILFPPELAVEEQNFVERLLRSEVVENFESIRIHKDGKLKYVSITISPVMDSAGKLIGYSKIVRDLTDHKASEIAIHKSDIHLKTAQRIAKLGSWEFDVNTQHIIWSDEVFRIFGRDPNAGIPSYEEIQQYWHIEDREKHNQIVKTAIETAKPYDLESRFYRPDGTIGYAAARGEPIFDASGKLVQLIGTILDITERKRAEIDLQNLSDRLSLAVKSGAIAIWNWNVPENILNWDDRMYELYGISPDQFTSIYDAWANSLHPEDRPNAEAAIQHALAGIKDYDPIFRVIHPDGSIRFIQAYALVQRNPHGEAVNMVGINIDITDQKLAEFKLQQSSSQLAASNKELEAFSYSVSHDLRSPLRSIDGFSNLILQKYSDLLPEVGIDYFQRIKKASQKMGQLIDDLLKLSQINRTTFQLEELNLSEMAESITKDLIISEPDRKCGFMIQRGIFVKGDRGLMNILLQNLLFNAWKYTRKKSEANIEFGTFLQNEKKVYFVRDNGAGFDMKYVDKLFGAFQRLHTDHEFTGTGIGLAIAMRVITRHGGKIWTEAEVEKGATFYFTISEFGEPN